LQANTTAVYFAVNDPVTAEEVSKRLGDFTEVVTSGGTSTGGSTQRQEDGAGGSFTRSHGANDNWSQVARRLLKPEEVCALDPRVAITFTPGVPPIWTWLLRYYEEPRMAQMPNWWSRLMTAVKTFALSVTLAICAVAIAYAVIVANVQVPQSHRGTSPRSSWSPRE
jgi:type IV secretion system protein VirD4